jgi:hypothetical protein
MKLSKEFETLIKQSLFDRYAVEDLKITREQQKDFIRFSLKGLVNNESFVGSLNIVEHKDSTASFTMTGWFDGNSRSFMNHVLKDNIYTNTISEIGEFLHSNFSRPITTVVGRFHIGMGEFSLDGKKITNISINANPAFRSRIEIIPKEKDKVIDNILLEISYIVKDGQSHFNYATKDEAVFYTSVNNMDLDSLKKILLREYMTAYSLLTEIPNLLSFDEFNTLSYQHIIDYLTVQQMNDI